jgi:hypothetical protein
MPSDSVSEKGRHYLGTLYLGMLLAVAADIGIKRIATELEA